MSDRAAYIVVEYLPVSPDGRSGVHQPLRQDGRYFAQNAFDVAQAWAEDRRDPRSIIVVAAIVQTWSPL